MKSNKKLIILLSIIAVILLVYNLMIITNNLSKPTCIKDVCFYGQGSSNPYQFIKQLNQNEKVILVNEAPANASQTGAFISKSMVELASTFPKKPVLISIALDENKKPVNCYCEKQVNKQANINTQLNSTVLNQTNSSVLNQTNSSVLNKSKIAFVNCNYTLQQCLNVKPKQGEFMIYLKYPDYSQNKVFFKNNNTVEIQAKTGVDLLAISTIFKGMI